MFFVMRTDRDVMMWKYNRWLEKEAKIASRSMMLQVFDNSW